MSIASASPSEVTLVEEALETVPRQEATVTPLIVIVAMTAIHCGNVSWNKAGI